METTSEPIIEIRNLVISRAGNPDLVGPSQLVIDGGDMVAIIADAPLAGRYLLRVLATLESPERGEYRFKGMRVDLNSDQQCLAVKCQIGYVAPDAAMVSNRTLRENLLLTRFYHENDLTIDIDETVYGLCKDAGLVDKLDQRPSALSGTELLKAIAIREIAKAPAVMLIEFPEYFLQLKESDGLFQHLKRMIRLESAVVFYSHNSELVGLANRRLTLAGGSIRTVLL
jgi:ABC-type lipoprotein export system ATPase subunit